MKIQVAILDSRIAPEEERLLTLRGFRVITLPAFSRLSEAVASHPDMLIAKVGNEYVSYADYSEEASYVFSDLSLLLHGTGARFHLTSDEVGAEYPRDVGLNALLMGNKLFCRVASASKALIEQAKAHGLKIIDVKQGYPACTVLKLSDKAAITADCGMAKALTKEGIHVTLIDEGHITLPPYEHGFIGGAGEVCRNQLYFFGDPSTHPDFKKIKAAAESEGLTIVPLSNGTLRDLGGIIFTEGNID